MIKKSAIKLIIQNDNPHANIDRQASLEPTDVLPDTMHFSEEQSIVAEYNLRLISLVMIKQLMHLCRDTQKHRGLGMGLLAGKQEFSPRFRLLQKQMARRINALYVFCQDEKNPFTLGDLDKVNEAWGTIKEGWHDDSVLENFQFHSYFIEQLLQMVMKLSQCLPSSSTQYTYANPRLSETAGGLSELKQKDDLLIFICYQLPRMIEFLGMVRALATHSATLGHNIEEHDKKLKYLCQCVRTEKLHIIEIAERLHQYMSADIPSLLALRTYEFKVEGFIDKVMDQVVGQSIIAIDSDTLFATATEIMDVYWRVVDDGIDVLHHHQDQILEAWYLRSP
jgi:hypothetical protein